MAITRTKRLPGGIAALTGLLILSACASPIMKSYIGAPISRVMLDYGPPDNVYDLGPGARAYQWRKQKRQVVPGQSSGEIRDTRRGKRYERERREDGSGVSKPSSAALRRARLA